MGNPTAQESHPTQQPVAAHGMEAAPPAYLLPPPSNPDAVTSPQPVANPAITQEKGIYGGSPTITNEKAVARNGAPVLAYPVATPLSALRAHPQPVDCPFCGMRGMTTVQSVHSTMTQYGSPFPPPPFFLLHLFQRRRNLQCTTTNGHSNYSVSALLLCVLCCCLAFVPYATGLGDDTEHRCGACRRLLAISRYNEGVEVVAYAPAVPVQSPPLQRPAATAGAV